MSLRVKIANYLPGSMESIPDQAGSVALEHLDAEVQSMLGGAIPDPLELGAAIFTNYVAIGDAPATTGAIRMTPDDFIYAGAPGGFNNRIIGWSDTIDGGNVIVLGSADTDPAVIPGDPGSQDLGSLSFPWKRVWANEAWLTGAGLKSYPDNTAQLGSFDSRFSALWAVLGNSDPGVAGGFYYKAFSDLQATDRVAVVSAGA